MRVNISKTIFLSMIFSLFMAFYAEASTIRDFSEIRYSGNLIINASSLIITNATDNPIAVGIGTSTPGAKLEVINDSAYEGLLLNITNGATDFVYNATTGNVGIGTTGPNALLSFGTSVQDNKLYLFDAASDKYGFGIRDSQFMIYSGAGGVSTGGITFGKFDGTTFTEVMRIRNDGNVGIGTTTPGAKLEVINDSAYEGLLLNITNGATNFVYNATTGNVGIGTTAPNIELDVNDLTAGQVPHILLRDTIDNPLSDDGWGYKQLSFVQQNGSTVWEQGWQQGGLRFTVSDNNALFLKKDGNVGIGTTGPLVRLNVVEGASYTWPVLGTASGNLFLASTDNLWGMFQGVETGSGGGWIQVMRKDSATAYNLALQPVGGNVGIGDTAPAAPLQLLSGAGAADTPAGGAIFTRFHSGTSYRGGSIFSYYYAANVDGDRDTLSFGVSGDTTPYVVGKVKMVITELGNVGIGTTSPDHDLEIGTGTYSEINAGETTFTAGSSKEFKENFEDVDEMAVLDKMRALPIKKYNLKKEFALGLLTEGNGSLKTGASLMADDVKEEAAKAYQNLSEEKKAEIDRITSKERIGPMAEDFYQLFGWGEPDRISGDHLMMANMLATKALIKENDMLKSELCRKDDSYSWCTQATITAEPVVQPVQPVNETPSGQPSEQVVPAEETPAEEIPVNPANSAPVIESFSPEGDVGMSVGSSQEFSVVKSDADAGDVLSVQWYVNNLAVSGEVSDSYTFASSELGEFEVKVLVTDGKDYSTHKWAVTVEEGQGFGITGAAVSLVNKGSGSLLGWIKSLFY